MATSTATGFSMLSSTNESSRAHQIVVIAKPSPGCPYRQLACAFQSCSCTQSIMIPCLKALRAFSDEGNRVGVQQEIQFAADHQAGLACAEMTESADNFYQTTEQKDADCGFPYIAATLVSSMATGCLGQDHAGYDCSLEKPFHSVKVDSLAADDILYEECDTEISVGVIDITNLQEPRYCFLNTDEKCIKCGLFWFSLLEDNVTDESASWEATDYTPLSCEAFVSYLGVDVDVISHREVEALEELKAYPVIDIAALAICWPTGAWNSTGQLEAYTNQAPASTDGEASRRGARSLSEHARERILDAILSERLDDLALLDEPMLFRGFQQSLLSVCARRVDELVAFEHQVTIADLLARLFEGNNHVDLYSFRQLPVSTILLVLHSDRLRGMKSLNLSGLFVGCPDKIWTALDVIPNLPEVVYVLSPPNADKMSEEEVLNSFPPNTGRDAFWERMGSTKIIISAAVSIALVSHCSTRPSTNLSWKQISISNLRELLSGDTLPLQLLPRAMLWEQQNHSWIV